MKKSRKQGRKGLILGIWLLMFMLMPGQLPALAAETEASTETATGIHSTTKVTGIKYRWSAKKEKTLTDTITVVTEGQSVQRKLKLQRYNSKKNRWTSVQTYTVPASGEVTITYPAKYRSNAYTTWRIRITRMAADADGNTADAYTSGNITIVTKDASASLSIGSKAAVIYDVKAGKFVYKKNMNRRLPMASTTKLMTAYVLLSQKAVNGTASITSDAVTVEDQSLNMTIGDQYNVTDLFNAMLISSSNDAAAALAIDHSGSISAFAGKMNKAAAGLGMTNTHYVNPHGLTEAGHYTTAKDLAVLTGKLWKYKTFRQVIAKRAYSFGNLSGSRSHTVYTTDKLLGSAYFKGGKTGYTMAAGCCFSGIYKYNSRVYVIATLGNSTSAGRWADVQNLFTYLKSCGYTTTVS